jgi:hypothetical protein
VDLAQPSHMLQCGYAHEHVTILVSHARRLSWVSSAVRPSPGASAHALRGGRAECKHHVTRDSYFRNCEIREWSSRAHGHLRRWSPAWSARLPAKRSHTAVRPRCYEAAAEPRSRTATVLAARGCEAAFAACARDIERARTRVPAQRARMRLGFYPCTLPLVSTKRIAPSTVNAASGRPSYKSRKRSCQCDGS